MKIENNKKVYIINDNIKEREEAAELMQGLGYEVELNSTNEAFLQSVIANLQQDPEAMQSEAECAKAVERFNTLTNREKQVVEYLALGAGYSTNKSVAKKMDISHRTVEEYRAEAMRKMQAESFKDLITIVITCKLFKRQ